MSGGDTQNRQDGLVSDAKALQLFDKQGTRIPLATATVPSRLHTPRRCETPARIHGTCVGNHLLSLSCPACTLRPVYIMQDTISQEELTDYPHSLFQAWEGSRFCGRSLRLCSRRV